MNLVKLFRGTFFPVLLLLAVVSGCGMITGKKEAEAVVARHFQMIATNGFDAAMADYGSQFFVNVTRQEWTNDLAKISAKLGAYQSYQVTSWRINEGASVAGAGTTVLIECEVVYSKYPATERFSLFKGLTDSDYKILGHHISSKGLLAE